MTAVMIEGWDLASYRDWSEYIWQPFGFGGGNDTEGFKAGRFSGSYALRLVASTGYSACHNDLTKSLPGTYAEAIFGFALCLDEGKGPPHNNGTRRDYPIIQIAAADGHALAGIVVHGDNTIGLRGYDLADLGSTAWTATPFKWDFYELRVKVAGASGEVELRINSGASDLGVVSNSNGSSGVKVVGVHSYVDSRFEDPEGFGVNAQFGVTTDDLYVVDCTTGASPSNTFLGDVRVETLRPNGAGANTGWVPNTGANYAAVDDPGSHDGDTTYVRALVAGMKDTYAFADTTDESSNIFGVQHNMLARQDESHSSRSLQAVIRQSGIDRDVGSVATLSTSWQQLYALLPTSPDTGAQWLDAEVAAAEYGMKVVS